MWLFHHRIPNRNQGFTLIQLSVLIAVTGLLAASLIPGAKENNTAMQYQTTMTRIGMVQQAMRNYMAVYGRLPCPALGYTHIGNSSFGVQATSGTSCDSTNLLNNGNTYVGIVPVKTLGLPDQIAFDGFGRRLSFAVDGRTVTNLTCQALQDVGTRGALDIRSSAAGATDMNAMWLVISHGKDGHGAYPQNGVTDSTYRINTGLTDTDTLTNANVTANATVGGSLTASVDAVFVRKARTTTFDDIVWTDRLYANKCAIGATANQGWYITIEDANPCGTVTPMSIGDFNGDGYRDIAMSCGNNGYNGKANSGSLYLVFGSSTAVTTGFQVNGTGANPTRVRIDGPAASSYFGNRGDMVTGDVNGDGIDDIIIGTINSNGVYVLFGRSVWATNTDVSTTVSGTMATGFIFKTSGMGDQTTFGGRVATGDVNGDGLKDIIIGSLSASVNGAASAGRVYVLFGRRTPWPATTMTFGTTLTDPIDYVAYNHTVATDYFGYTVSAGDINGDGYADVVATTNPSNTTTTFGELYVIYGKSSPTTISTSALNTSTGVKFTSDPSLSAGICATVSYNEGVAIGGIL